MAIVTTGRFAWPEPFVASHTSSTITSTAMRHAVIMQAPVSGSLSKVLVRIGSVTTSAAMRVRIESLTSAGVPSGTLLAAGSESSIASPSVAVFEVTLDTPVTVAKGDHFAIVCDAPSGTPSMGISRLTSDVQLVGPWAVRFDGSVWGNTNVSAVPVGGVYIAGAWQKVPGMWPSLNALIGTFATNTSPSERGNKITMPHTVQVDGVWFVLSATTPGPFEAVIYNSSDAVVASQLLSTTALITLSTQAASTLRFATAVTLTQGQTYRVCLKPTTTTSMSLRLMQVYSGTGSAHAFSDLSVQSTYRTGAGAWTDTSEEFCCLGLIVTGVDDNVDNSGGRKYFNGTSWVNI